MFRSLFSRLFQRTPLARTARRRVRRKTGSYRPELVDLESRTLLSTITWLRPVGGDWDDPANWAGGQVPGSRDAAVIPFRDITVTHSMPTDSVVQSITNEATLDISAGSLLISGGSFGNTPSRTDGLITVSGGALTIGQDSAVVQGAVVLNGSGAVRNFATLNLMPQSTFNVAVDNEAGLFIDTGNINNDASRPFVNGPSATLRVGGNIDDSVFGPAFIANGFTNQGRIKFVSQDNQDLVVQSGTVVNAPGASIDFSAGAARNASSLVASLDNQGTVTATFGTIGVSSATVTNEGTVTVTGSLEVSQSAFTNSGTITLANSSAVFTVLGGTFATDGGSLSGPGTLDLANTTATLTPEAANAVAALAVSRSTLTSPGTLTNLVGIHDSTINADVVNHVSLVAQGTTISGSFTNAPGATLTIGGNLNPPATTTVTGGLTNDSSIVLINGDLTVTGGPLTNALAATIRTGRGDTEDSADTSFLNAALDNQGTLTVQEATILTGSVANSGTVNLQGFVGDLTVNPADPMSTDPTFVNTGSITVQSLRGLTVGGDFINSGTVSLTGFGSAVVSGNYTQTDGSTQLTSGLLTANLVDLEGGVLAGTGVINATVLNNAELDVGQPGSPGTLTIVGDYTQTAGGVLVIEIGGRSSGTDFDQLNVTGQATLDGTLTVNLINGFVPHTGDSFQVLTFGSETGTFATLDGDGPLFTPSFDLTDVTLVAN